MLNRSTAVAFDPIKFYRDQSGTALLVLEKLFQSYISVDKLHTSSRFNIQTYSSPILKPNILKSSSPINFIVIDTLPQM